MTRHLKNLAHLGLAILANMRYGFPSRKLKVIGVTGTDGKTTTTSLIHHILDSAGRKAAMITTVGAAMGGQSEQMGLHVTTPPSFAVQRFLKRALDSGSEFVVLETSSHGIDQNRVWGVSYAIAVITNVTHEHLDYHKTFQAYAGTKLKFMKSAPVAIVNVDDKTVAGFIPQLTGKVVTYSRTSAADVTPERFPFKSPLFGDFNQSNALAAIAACREAGIPDQAIRDALLTFKAPAGRQEMAHDGEFKVMVDFAHTPNAVESILREVKGTNPKRLVHLFGSPGRRDVDKRPLMGAASSRYADVIIVTADDPRDERVEDVNAAIISGIKGKFTRGTDLFEFSDRMDAVSHALGSAQPGDFILMTGKGHEPTLAVGDKEIPWDEAKIVRDWFLRK